MERMNKRRRFSRRSRAAKSAGARDIQSPMPAPTSPRCRQSARTKAITGSSTARKSGPLTPTNPTGFSRLSAPIRKPPSMTSKGVSTKPIRLISGKSPFCETFFDDVHVPKEHGPGVNAVVGTINRGWDVAKYLLTHEREMIGAGGGGLMGGRGIGEMAAQQIGLDDKGRLADPMLRAKVAQAEIDGWAFLLTMERLKNETKTR